VANVISRLGDCDRTTLLQTALDVLRQDSDLTGFPESPWGCLVARATYEALESGAWALGAPAEFLSEIEFAKREFINLIGNAPIPLTISRSARNRLRGVYSFRGGIGSVEVFDVREHERRGDADLARYDVDFTTFYRRANWIGKPSIEEGPVIAGFVKARRLSLSLSLNMASANQVGLHAPSGHQIELRVDGKSTAWEALLHRRDHVVGLFPAHLRDMLSWREDIFESADGRIALLDDDAVVGAFLFSRILD
jgi:hypothetical protein